MLEAESTITSIHSPSKLSKWIPYERHHSLAGPDESDGRAEREIWCTEEDLERIATPANFTVIDAKDLS